MPYPTQTSRLKKDYDAPTLEPLGTLTRDTAGPEAVSDGVDALIGQSGGFQATVNPS